MKQPYYRVAPPAGWPHLQLAEIPPYRDLLFFLVWRGIRLRYQQTVIGIFWVILQPLLTMLIFTLLLGNWIKVPTAGVPYPLFAFAALVPWNFFTHCLTKSTFSLLDDKATISKVYFPRLLLPLAAVLAGFVDLLISFAALLVMLLFYGWTPAIQFLLLPLIMLWAICAALGIGLWLAALNVEYRDISNAVPFLLQIWFFITPVVYPVTVVPSQWQWLLGLNPMTAVIEGFRWSLFGSPVQIPWQHFALSGCSLFLISLGGLYFFRHKEPYFADVI
jgi:lipopolysaccharide transport system permease protein